MAATPIDASAGAQDGMDAVPGRGAGAQVDITRDPAGLGGAGRQHGDGGEGGEKTGVHGGTRYFGPR